MLILMFIFDVLLIQFLFLVLRYFLCLVTLNRSVLGATAISPQALWPFRLCVFRAQTLRALCCGYALRGGTPQEIRPRDSLRFGVFGRLGLRRLGFSGMSAHLRPAGRPGRSPAPYLRACGRRPA